MSGTKRISALTNIGVPARKDILPIVDVSQAAVVDKTKYVELDSIPGPDDTVSIEAFGCVLDGTTDDTAAFQAALDSGKKLTAPAGEMLITDTILLEPGAYFVGAGGVANYANAKTKIKFSPSSKKDVFNWKDAPSSYVYEGVTLKGFTIRGYGSFVSACLDLPYLYNGDLHFFAYAGVDALARVEKWLDCDFKGGVQGFSVVGVEFKNTSGLSTDVSTSSNFDLYISQGPTGYIFQNYGAYGVNIYGVVESVDVVFEYKRGNTAKARMYVENAPRTDASAAFLIGKSGSAPATATFLDLELIPCSAYSGGTAATCVLADIDYARFVKISGYVTRFGNLLATTANTQRVVLADLDVDNTAWLSASATAIYDMAAITMVGFRPRNVQTRGDSYYADYDLAARFLELFPLDRASLTRRKLGVDKWTGKLRRVDAYGNLTSPIGFLETTANSGWTFNSARLAPGELVVHGTTAAGQVALWRSQRHTKDAGNSYASCSTTSGSAVISRTGGFFPTEINDWVTVSSGFPSTTTQYRVVDRAADYSTITLDTNATSTVSAAATVATEAHNLVAVGQQGYRSGAGDPTGSVTPYFIGEEYLRTGTGWYKSTGLTSSDWQAL